MNASAPRSRRPLARIGPDAPARARRQAAGYDPDPDLVLVAAARRLLGNGGARRIRERAGIRRAELAAAAGVSVPDLSRWEAGAATLPYGERAVRYSRRLAELAELVGVGGEPDAT